jgi:prepilin-type N-terminal cleavage/methylation domain-containing protein
MKFLGWLHRNQRGFTLIEMLMVIAISGIITAGLALSVIQIFNGNAQSSSKMLAVRQVQNAGYFISQDTLMAQAVTPDLGVTGFPLTLTWTDWNSNAIHEVVYTLLAGRKLQRETFTDSSLDTVTFVAEYIDATCQFTDGKLILTVTASIGGYRPATETRTYEITPRPFE